MAKVARARRSTWHAGLALVLLVLAACGADTPAGAATPTRSPAAAALLFLTDSRGDAAGNAVFQVEAYQQGKQRWAVSLPAPGDALAVANGLVYVGAGQMVLALDAATGQVRWMALASPQVRAISVIGSQVYVDTGGGFAGQERLVVLSLDGQALWTYQPPDLQDSSTWLVAGGLFYTVESGVPATLVARDAATGALRFSAPLQLDSLPQELRPSGPDALLVVTQDALVMVRRSDGALLWQRQNTQAVGAEVSSGTLYAFFVDQPAALGGAPPVFLRALRVSDGALLWQQPLSSHDAGFLSSGQPLNVGAITPQAAYLVDSPDFTTLHAWSLSDGSQRWTKTLPGGVAGLLADGQRVYLAASPQLLALDGDTSQVVWQQPNPAGLTGVREEAGELLGSNPLTDTLAGYDLATGQQLWQVHPQALDQYLLF